jgi:hypothetical protein
MGLADLYSKGKIEERPASKKEIADLLSLADIHLKDAYAEGVSIDGRFNHAYDAVLVLANIPLRCMGYRTKGEGHHSAVFEALPEIMGKELSELASYYQTCRVKRNTSTYSKAHVTSKTEMQEIIKEAEDFSRLVRRWLKEKYPQFC